MIYSFIQTFGRLGINFLFFAYLAVKLRPEELGIVSVGMLISAFIQSFSELGFGAALIHKKNVSKDHYSTVFYANLLLSVFWSVSCFVFAKDISIIFNSEGLIPILKVLSIGFIVNSASLIQIAILQKELRFKDLAKRDILSSIAGAVAGIMGVLCGAGVWSFVIQIITNYIIGAVTIWRISEWRPMFNGFSFRLLNELWPYSSKILITNLLTFATKNVDRIIIGGLLGPHALGIYTFGYNLILLPIIALNGAIGMYLFPKYSAMHERIAEIKSSYFGVMKILLFLLIPIVIIFSQFVGFLINLIWGNVWVEAIPISQALCAAALLGSLIAPSGQLMKSFGKPEWLIYWSIFSVSLSSIFIYLGIEMAGLEGVSFGLIFSGVFSLPVVMTVLNRLIDVKINDIIKLLTPILLASISMVVIFMVGRAKAYTEFFQLSITSILALLIYISVIYIFERTAQDVVKLFLSGERRIIILFKKFATYP